MRVGQAQPSGQVLRRGTGCPCFGVHGKRPLLSETTRMQLTQDVNPSLSVLAKQVACCRLPKAFLKKKDANPLLRYGCPVRCLPSAQSHVPERVLGFPAVIT